MAVCSTSLLLLLLSALMTISTIVNAEADDEAALLAFKAAAISSTYHDPLASWNNSSDGGFCSWEGVRCGARHSRVVALILPSHTLAGILAPAIGNLSFLRTLDLSYNGFSGEIPASLGRLRRLQTLNLSHNVFSGELPSNLSSCTNIMVMRIRVNQLYGRVPPELGNKLTRLMDLDLRYNYLNGPIPSTLANLSSLYLLDLSINELEGTIPPSLGSMPGLKFVDVAYNNLSAEPPDSLYNLSLLVGLQVQGNMLRGGIPANIGSRFPSIQILAYGKNQFTGSIPASLSNLSVLQDLELSRNMLSGYVPHTLGRLRALRTLFLYSNRLQADDRVGWEFIDSLSNCSQLQKLYVGDNARFTGQLPSSIANLSSTLQFLSLENTGIYESIPSAIGNLINLNTLSVMNILISGVLPESIGNLANLNTLSLYSTNLSGQIPSSIGNLSKLTLLVAYHTNLDGPIPASMGKLNSLLALDLSMNNLNGSIPRDFFKLAAISIYLNLSYNSLSGPLPSEIGSLGNLNNLALSGNKFSGEIPESIARCTVLQQLRLDNNYFEGSIPQSLNNIKGLSALNLSMNRLSGSIPDAIGSIHDLQLLDLAHNNFSGSIPTVLQNLTSLSILDLSFNSLQGEVPKNGIFRNLINLAIVGNNELCGGTPQLHLPPCHNKSVTNKKNGFKPLTIALVIIGLLLFLVIVIASIQLIHKKLSRNQMTPFLPAIIEEQYERFSYHALANGTDGFSEAKLLGKGSFGAVYKCTFQDEGTIVAVKVFNIERSGSNRSFVAECEALRRVRHRCLVKVITCCSSIDNQGQEFKALVFEYMPNGNLNEWLHPKTDKATLRNPLSLEQRLDIAVNIMDALDYLHNHCQPQIVHCDLKRSNILLAEDMSARVGDFGISKILSESTSTVQQSSTSGMRGSIGYVAPEYGEGASASTLGDVYSLGILLLEVFTGLSPIDDMFGSSLDLHKFSDDAFPERIWEIADKTMWLHVNTNDRFARKTEKCLVSVIALGISCSKKTPRERTLIQDAVTEIHAIRDSYLQFARSIVVKHGGLEEQEQCNDYKNND